MWYNLLLNREVLIIMKRRIGIQDIIKSVNNEIKTEKISEEKLEFYLEIIQKERMFHLVVTMFTAVFCILFLGIFLVIQNIYCSILFIIFLIMESFYIGYYYKLENNALEWEIYLGDMKFKLK